MFNAVFCWLNAWFQSPVGVAMFSFLKRSAKIKAENDFSDTLPLMPPASIANAASSVTRTPHPASEALALEIREGNADADWSAWHDSVAFQDSQPHTGMPLCEPQKQARQQSRDEISDAFASVGKYTA
jgi:hypothetical protein